MPKISIIIPVFNTQSYLPKCIESCINQSIRDIEIILVDDKSTDSSLNIIESYNDTRIKCIKNTNNLGTFLARAEGIKAASGAYIVFLDADDYLRLDTLEILLEIAERENADIVHFGIINEPLQKYATLPKIHDEILIGDNIAYQIIIKDFNHSWLTLCGRMYQTALVKTAIEKLSFINKHLISSEDTLLFFVIVLLAQKSAGVKKNLYIYCNNKHSIMRTKNNERLWKQINDREYLKNALWQLEGDIDLQKNKYFLPAKHCVSNMLNYFICFSKKFFNAKELNVIISPYIMYSMLSMKYMPRWQTIVKLLIFIVSFGKKKL